MHMQAEAALELELASMAAVWGEAETSVSLMASSDVPLLDNLDALQARLPHFPSDADPSAHNAIALQTNNSFLGSRPSHAPVPEVRVHGRPPCVHQNVVRVQLHRLPIAAMLLGAIKNSGQDLAFLKLEYFLQAETWLASVETGF